MGELIYQWIDLLWLPVGWFAVHKHQRIKAMAFIAMCLIIFRTQVEFIESTGFTSGFLPILDMPAHARGLIIYGLTIAVFLILAHYSRKTQAAVIFAASLSLFFFAFIAFFLVMIL